LIVTDLAGTPVTGQIAVTIYDKSVEYISGGSNVGDIKEFFWKWRRSHYPQSASNLNRYWDNFADPGKRGMENLGIFGHIGAIDEKMQELAMDTSGVMYSGGMMGGMSSGNKSRRFTPNRMAGGMGGMGGGREISMSSMSPASAPMQESSMEFEMDSASDVFFDGNESGGAFVEPTVRSNFADTALWIGALETNKDGVAKIELDMPESLTTWKINVWSMALGTRVGYGNAEVITRKDFIIRMQTPRFLIEKDKVVFSANVHNYLAKEKEAKVSLEMTTPAPPQEGNNNRPSFGGADNAAPAKNNSPPVEGWHFAQQNDGVVPPAINLLDESTQTQTVRIPPNGEARVDWLVEAKTAGDAVITMKALTDEESDAMQKTLPVYVHGMLKQDSFSTFIAPAETSATVEIKVPAERKPEQTKLTVQFSPTLAASMIDALPYLVDYPYGCTEQTLNKFLPTVIVRKIIGDGWDLCETADGRRQTAEEKDKEPGTERDKKEPGTERSAVPGWAIARKTTPVFDKEQIDEMVQVGVTRLTNMQCSDGGWGWFSGYGERSSGHLTALVLHGLYLAQSCGVEVSDDVLRRGRTWLQRYQDGQIVLLKNAALPDKKNINWKDHADETDAFVFMVLAEKYDGGAIDAPTADMLEFLQRDRGKLSLYGVGMVGIAETMLPGKHDVSPYLKIFEQYLVQDDENQTAYLNLKGYSGWCWWYWHGSEFETHAYYLKLLMRADQKSPIAPRLVKYLLNNRKHATYWNSTRDTAIVIEAFAEYLNATGEGKPNATVEVLVDGEVKKTVEFTPENFLITDNTLVLEGEEVSTGTHKVELRKKGDAPMYITAYLENFTLEDPIEKAGLEVKIERRIYRLDRDESAKTQAAGGRGQVVDMKVEKYKRELLAANGAIQSGDLIEVELLIESKNDYESLLIEDWKAAGLEPVDVRSGYNGNELGAYIEFRDERVVFFVHRLARGKHSVTYRLRAEIPGEFSALPARMEAMYAPELKGNSDEDKVNVVDK
jgi:uncharacterized protein YfaS (alpha-2-macroglobulin family)